MTPYRLQPILQDSPRGPSDLRRRFTRRLSELSKECETLRHLGLRDVRALRLRRVLHDHGRAGLLFGL